MRTTNDVKNMLDELRQQITASRAHTRELEDKLFALTGERLPDA